MNRQSQSAVLFLLGAALLHAGATDLYLRYVKAGLRPLLLAAGAVLIVTALATSWYERRRTKRHRPRPARRSADGRERDARAPSAAPRTDDEAGAPLAPRPDDGATAPAAHAHPEPRVAWLLVLPLLALILVAPPALGSYSATRTGTALQEPLAYPSLPATDPLPLGVVDYAGRAFYDHGRTLAGREVRLTGFVALDHDGTPYLVRMALNCCAADAQPVKIGLTGRIPPVLQPDAWLTVTGVYTPRTARDPVNGGPIPFLEVTRATPAPTPEDPYDESWNN
ncbi:TIGR03943 family putative permease subunit [Streptomyces hilarionis]|uniref:TIGR03943 family putative permease subunit n=1 Tax=Streptomyces hilarionis TaxID=2839954 RepID=UPI002119EE80|nr:TIGR03943 family protein [Streptomyces hilarionis]MCQ9132423.1 TIGR03943 family protein [Streptomyces hilarionis]